MLCFLFFLFNLVSLICPIVDGSEGGDDLSAIPPEDENDAPVSDATPSEEPDTGDGDPGLYACGWKTTFSALATSHLTPDSLESIIGIKRHIIVYNNVTVRA